MTKKVYRYFFDFLKGQEKWLNKMADKGYRLIECSQLSYVFETCNPSEYEYVVELVGDKTISQVKEYKKSLLDMGYKALSKNINANYSIGKVRWRPWAKGLGQIATSPGTYNHELLIVEKKADGVPFKLHTNRLDILSMYRTARNMYVWGISNLFVLLVLTLLVTNSVNPIILCLQVLIFLFLVLWAIPTVKLMLEIQKLKVSE